MSELINNPSQQRKDKLRSLLLRVHAGEDIASIREELIQGLTNVPYNEVMEVEQEMINSNLLTEQEILEFCDIHTDILDGKIDQSGAKAIPAGHPVDTFQKENVALKEEIEKARKLIASVNTLTVDKLPGYVMQMRTIFNALSDIDKHYKRKEYLLFPYMEKHLITGPPTVMWGKHDELRGFLNDAIKELESTITSVQQIELIIENYLNKVLELIDGMIMKEEEILFPMAMNTLTEEEWYKIYTETIEFGFCLIDPEDEWKPEGVIVEKQGYIESDAIRLSSGTFDIKQLEALFLHIPIDITFVDANDKVAFFSHSPNRVFERNRSIIGRDVRMCHPQGSVHIVEQIISDFKSGKENKAVFWMSNFMGRFIYIEYSAVRDKENNYLGVVEVTQDITAMRKLEGDQRLLSYSDK
ncbi:MAG: DUF438 domain-containing protein [Dysgonamonadaceae bacterium]|nr:DUF438 domain-containing protein [Dysgonamonadaceae bacterium]MDD4727160.1 DUF438 domain-containing protein [Dysgonamonadaceae bacterium]